MAAGGTPNNVDLGPGRLYAAEIGTQEPTSVSAAVPSAWRVIGYTLEGSVFSFETTTEGVMVAEEIDPIRFVATARTSTVEFVMAETTVSRLALALGAGASIVDSAASFEFPDPDQQKDVMLLWDKMDVPDANNRRYLFRQCRPSGTISIENRKAPTVRGISVTFNCSKPSAASPVRIYPSASGGI